MESGSRAWGFASPDSDYDVRFIYAHDIEWYLKLEKKRYVLELELNDTYDINGWDKKRYSACCKIQILLYLSGYILLSFIPRIRSLPILLRR